MNSCVKCGENIDKGACGTLFTVITFYDDLANERLQKKRIYLCEGCSFSLNRDLGFPITFQEES